MSDEATRPAVGDVRAITVRNYWAWALVYAGKNPENRAEGALHWPLGTTLVHAAKELDPPLEHALTRGEGWVHLRPPLNDPRRRSMLALREAVRRAKGQALQALEVRGAVIGVGELVDIHPATRNCCSSPWAEDVHWTLDRKQRKGATAHLVFEGVRPVWPPIECSGALGLWRPAPDVLEALDLAS